MSSTTDDFIRVHGNLSYVNMWLKMLCLVLLLVTLSLAGALLIKIQDSRAEHIVPIVINQATGDAIAVDYRVVDAAGEERSPFELRKFCEDFLAEAYTYNRYTVKSKLESLSKWTSPEALLQVREALKLPHRSELLSRNAQGLAEVSSFMVTETKPLIKVQIYFKSRVLSQTDEIVEEDNSLGAFVIKPIKRSTRNPHGLIVIDYRQSPFENNMEEK